MKQRVVIADDCPIFLEGLRQILGGRFDLVGSAVDGRALVSLSCTLAPDFVVAEIALPLLNGMDAARQIRKESKKPRILFLTKHRDPAFVTEALVAGVYGYVLKNCAPVELMAAIREVGKGRRYVTPSIRSPAVRGLIVGGIPQIPNPDPLTSRQREVLQLVAEGRSTKEIAGILNVSTRTVEFHRYRIMAGLQVHTTAELTRYAVEHGVIAV